MRRKENMKNFESNSWLFGRPNEGMYCEVPFFFFFIRAPLAGTADTLTIKHLHGKLFLFLIIFFFLQIIYGENGMQAFSKAWPIRGRKKCLIGIKILLLPSPMYDLFGCDLRLNRQIFQPENNQNLLFSLKYRIVIR